MKPFIVLLFFVIIFSFSMSDILAQTLPPKDGKYLCYIYGITTQAQVEMVFNPITKILEQRVGTALGSQLSPAPFNLVLNGKNAYSMPPTNGKGTYIFDSKTSKLSFTGDINQLTFVAYGIGKNGEYVMNFTDKTKTTYICEQKTNSNHTSNGSGNNLSNGILNQGLSGKILTTVSNQSNYFLGKVFEFDLTKGSYNIIFPNGVATENLNGEILYFDKESRLKITDKTGNTTIKQITNNVVYGFNDYYPAISNSGKLIALTLPNKSKTGSLTDLIANGEKIVVADRDGQSVAEFIGYKQAAWMPDGRLIVAGDSQLKQGLYLIEANFKSIKKLLQGYDYAQMPAVSPDGKQVAFANKGEIWSANLEGANLKQVVLGNVASFPAWSPDGKFIAVNVLSNSNSSLFIVNLQTDSGIYPTDINGKQIESRNRITWLPNILESSIPK
jgi:TolB protein